ncbi:MAG: hypothetical protein IKA85_07300 [Clostridia bacterium]|nr:hypothetical protein [Clostridia bacterium]
MAKNNHKVNIDFTKFANLFKNKKWLYVYYPIVALVLFLVFYVTLPAINFASEGFWAYLTFALILCVLPFIFKKTTTYSQEYQRPVTVAKLNPLALIVALPIIISIIGGIFSSSFFFAKTYSSVIDVKEAVFEEDMPETDNVTNIALMDTASAQIVGERTLGDLSDVVSQYEISETYNQINYKKTPKKVASLEYAGFFKWLGNKSKGIPGYVSVDPVSVNSAEYIEFKKPIYYTESAYFSKDLMRKLRFSYPTKILGEPHFELDDDDNPYYIVACYKPNVFMFGAKDVSEVIIFNPCDGSSVKYPIGNVPSWVDIVYDGYLASEKYNWQGMYSGGWLNSVIGQKGCKQTTDDFGYLILEDDVWYFTGVTSVNNDESNIGFILSNARTGEYKYYPVIGAEEYSAMGAAEGEVQEKGYKASFPALINVKGEATYIMVLKDDNGLVKLYALVNVKSYGIVATGTTQQKAMDAYKELLYEHGILSGEEVSTTNEVEITVHDIWEVDKTIYIRSTDKQVFKTAFDEKLLLIFSGDKIKITYNTESTSGIFEIVKYTKQ